MKAVRNYASGPSSPRDWLDRFMNGHRLQGSAMNCAFVRTGSNCPKFWARTPPCRPGNTKIAQNGIHCLLDVQQPPASYGDYTQDHSG